MTDQRDPRRPARADGWGMTPIILVALVVVLGLVYIFTSRDTAPQRGAANSASQPTNAPGTSKQP